MWCFAIAHINVFFVAQKYVRNIQVTIKMEKKLWSSWYVVPIHTMDTGGVEIQFHWFLTAVLIRGKWSASLPPREKARCTYQIGSAVCTKTGLYILEKNWIMAFIFFIILEVKIECADRFVRVNTSPKKVQLQGTAFFEQQFRKRMKYFR
jgi:hypothetical protein